jgi:hypothetical protein
MLRYPNAVSASAFATVPISYRNNDTDLYLPCAICQEVIDNVIRCSGHFVCTRGILRQTCIKQRNGFTDWLLQVGKCLDMSVVSPDSTRSGSVIVIAASEALWYFQASAEVSLDLAR